jgi:membrane protein DedA with SNARE-associated domain
MDALDMLTIMMFCVAGFVAAVIGMTAEYLYERRLQKRLHRQVWGNLVDLSSWRNSRKPASRIKR